jgi:hypothetical protein
MLQGSMAHCQRPSHLNKKNKIKLLQTQILIESLKLKLQGV